MVWHVSVSLLISSGLVCAYILKQLNINQIYIISVVKSKLFCNILPYSRVLIDLIIEAEKAPHTNDTFSSMLNVDRDIFTNVYYHISYLEFCLV